VSTRPSSTTIVQGLRLHLGDCRSRHPLQLQRDRSSGRRHLLSFSLVRFLRLLPSSLLAHLQEGSSVADASQLDHSGPGDQKRDRTVPDRHPDEPSQSVLERVHRGQPRTYHSGTNNKQSHQCLRSFLLQSVATIAIYLIVLLQFKISLVNMRG
jgi:hypothetical protein